MKLSTLRELCGSEASERGFLNRFRDAVTLLAQQGIIAPGWSIARGQVRWLKLHRSSSRAALDAPATHTPLHGD